MYYRIIISFILSFFCHRKTESSDSPNPTSSYLPRWREILRVIGILTRLLLLLRRIRLTVWLLSVRLLVRLLLPRSPSLIKRWLWWPVWLLAWSLRRRWWLDWVWQVTLGWLLLLLLTILKEEKLEWVNSRTLAAFKRKFQTYILRRLWRPLWWCISH